MNTLTWQHRVEALMARGHTLVSIGEAVGLSMQSISGIRNGRVTEPRGDAAVKLDRLYESECVAAPKRKRAVA